MNAETLRQELAHNAHVIQALVTGISQADAQHKPDAETWSILEVVCHLIDEERDDFRQRIDIVLHRPDVIFPPIHPSAWVTERRYNERDLSEMLALWLSERQQSLDFLAQLAAPDWDTSYTYPYGTVRAGDLLAAWVAHDILHMRQLIELRHTRLISQTTPFSVDYAGDW